MMIMCYISLNFGILKGQMDGFMGPGPGERLWAECGHRSVLEVPLTGDLHSRWTPGFFCVDPGMGTPGWDEDGGRGQRYHEIYPNKRLDIEIFLHHSTYNPTYTIHPALFRFPIPLPLSVAPTTTKTWTAFQSWWSCWTPIPQADSLGFH